MKGVLLLALAATAAAQDGSPAALEQAGLKQLVTIRRVFVDRLTGGETAAQMRDRAVDALASARAVVVAKHIVGDREEEGSKCALATKAFATLERRDEGLLHEILEVVADLVAEEARDGVEVPIEELGAAALIAAAPGVEELGVGHGRSVTMAPARRR